MGATITSWNGTVCQRKQGKIKSVRFFGGKFRSAHTMHARRRTVTEGNEISQIMVNHQWTGGFRDSTRAVLSACVQSSEECGHKHSVRHIRKHKQGDKATDKTHSNTPPGAPGRPGSSHNPGQKLGAAGDSGSLCCTICAPRSQRDGGGAGGLRTQGERGDSLSTPLRSGGRRCARKNNSLAICSQVETNRGVRCGLRVDAGLSEDQRGC